MQKFIRTEKHGLEEDVSHTYWMVSDFTSSAPTLVNQIICREKIANPIISSHTLTIYIDPFIQNKFTLIVKNAKHQPPCQDEYTLNQNET